MPTEAERDSGCEHRSLARRRWPRFRAAVAVPAIVGVTAGIGQIVVMREEVASFNGNELSVGIVLATWLFWTAVGSGLTNRFLSGRIRSRVVIATGACANGLSLALTVWGLREARAHMQVVPGESLSPVAIAVASITCLSMFCGLCGCQFSLAAKMYREDCAVSGELGTSYAYLWETVGFASGAIVTGIVFQRHFGSFQIATIVALLNFSIALWLTVRAFLWRFLLTGIAAASAIVFISRVAPRIEPMTQERLWEGFRLVLTEESVYGRIMILDSGGLRSIYQNGVILANIPDQASAEESVHYGLLEHPNPRKVLLIGGGLNGSVIEALKHPGIEQLDYVELDPALIELYRREFPAQWTKAFGDARVRVHAVDGRQYLNTSNEKFDVMIVDVSDPENAELNRFYTAEFYRAARNHLAPDGIIAVQLHASENAVSPALADFLRSIHATLRQEFPFVAVMPGDTVHFFGATRDGVLTEDAQALVQRLKTRGIETEYVREYSIPFRMTTDRMTELHNLLHPVAAAKVNHDFRPMSYYFSTTLWSSQFSHAYVRVLEVAKDTSFWNVVIGGVLALVLLFASMRLSGGNERTAAACSVVAAGFSLMAVQILSLFTFQSVFGYVYEEIAVLTGMFMAGMALGTWLGIVQIRKKECRKLRGMAVTGQLACAAAGLCLLGIAALMSAGSLDATGWQASRVAFPLLAGLCGIPGGFQFPVACAIYEGQRDGTRSASLYSFDLIGGCCGALLLSGILIPVFGFWRTAWLAASIGVTAAVLLVVGRRTSQASS